MDTNLTQKEIDLLIERSELSFKFEEENKLLRNTIKVEQEENEKLLNENKELKKQLKEKDEYMASIRRALISLGGADE